mmetsp:Transcript_6824/g.17712  ORF Transcript_6824/g.17712 Transcript_6824/m.17712 type:complete len:275 (-) Transcript_6824:631-1455(-)
MRRWRRSRWPGGYRRSDRLNAARRSDGKASRLDTAVSTRRGNATHARSGGTGGTACARHPDRRTCEATPRSRRVEWRALRCTGSVRRRTAPGWCAARPDAAWIHAVRHTRRRHASTRRHGARCSSRGSRGGCSCRRRGTWGAARRPKCRCLGAEMPSGKLLLRVAVRIVANVVQVQALRVCARLVLEERVAVLRRSVAGAHRPSVPCSAVDGGDALPRILRADEGDVRRARGHSVVPRAAWHVARSRSVRADLQNLSKAPEVLRASQHILAAYV